MPAGFVRRHASACFAAAAIAVFFVIFWLTPASSATTERQFVSEFTRLYEYISSQDQRRAFLAGVLAMAAFSAISYFAGRRGVFADRGLRFLPRLGTLACAALAILGLIACEFLTFPPILGWATALVSAFLLFVAAAPRLPREGVERAAAYLIGAYVAILIVPGLFVSPIPSIAVDGDSLAQIETHVLWLPMRGALVAAGQRFFTDLPVGYGLLMPSIMGVAEHRLHGLSIAEELRFVQASQVLFCLAALGAYLVYARRGRLGVVAALLLAGPYWASAGLGIWHPNQTGFRSLGLPLGMLALILSARLPPARAAWWLGAVAGVAFLLNLETAVAVAAGFVVFTIARTRTPAWTPLLRMAVAAAVAIIVCLLVFRLGLGRSPISFRSLDPLELMRRFAGGDFGLRLFISGAEGENYFLVPFVLLMFGHAMYVVIDGFRRLGRAPLPVHGALRMSAAVTLIVWLPYYFNAPNWWQIWTHLFLYGFLVIDALDRRRLGVGSRAAAGGSPASWLARRRTTPALLVLLLLLALMIPHTNRHLVKYMSGFMYPDWIQGPRQVAVVSGILLPGEQAEMLERKARRLAQVHALHKGSVVYLTFNKAFVPRLSGIFQTTPYRDMFGETPGDAAFDRVMAGLVKQRPETILIDAPEGPLAVSGARRDFVERQRAAIAAAYRLAATADGWEFWVPAGTR